MLNSEIPNILYKNKNKSTFLENEPTDYPQTDLPTSAIGPYCRYHQVPSPLADTVSHTMSLLPDNYDSTIIKVRIKGTRMATYLQLVRHMVIYGRKLVFLMVSLKAVR